MEDLSTLSAATGLPEQLDITMSDHNPAMTGKVSAAISYTSISGAKTLYVHGVGEQHLIRIEECLGDTVISTRGQLLDMVTNPKALDTDEQ